MISEKNGIQPVSDRTAEVERTFGIQLRNFGRSVVTFDFLKLFKKREQHSSESQSDRCVTLKSSMTWPQPHKNKLLKGKNTLSFDMSVTGEVVFDYVVCCAISLALSIYAT